MDLCGVGTGAENSTKVIKLLTNLATSYPKHVRCSFFTLYSVHVLLHAHANKTHTKKRCTSLMCVKNATDRSSRCRWRSTRSRKPFIRSSSWRASLKISCGSHSPVCASSSAATSSFSVLVIVFCIDNTTHGGNVTITTEFLQQILVKKQNYT